MNERSGRWSADKNKYRVFIDIITICFYDNVKGLRLYDDVLRSIQFLLITFCIRSKIACIEMLYLSRTMVIIVQYYVVSEMTFETTEQY